MSNSTRKKMKFRKISSQKFGINENTFYLCTVRINVLAIQVCFLRGQAVNVTTQFVKPYIKCAALVLSKTIHHHFLESFLKKNSPYIAEIMNSLEWFHELTRVNRWFHSSEVFGGIVWWLGLNHKKNTTFIFLFRN